MTTYFGITHTQGAALGCDAAWSKQTEQFARLNGMGSPVVRPSRSLSYQR